MLESYLNQAAIPIPDLQETAKELAEKVIKQIQAGEMTSDDASRITADARNGTDVQTGTQSSGGGGGGATTTTTLILPLPRSKS